MNCFKLGLALLAISSLTAWSLNAENIEQAPNSLSDALAIPDSVNNARVTIHQSEKMRQLMLRSDRKDTNRPTVKGYRVQVFSSNNAKSARNNALSIEKRILEQFPNMEIYVTYTAPFWKVRIGNCATNEEAQQLRKYINEKFPEYQNETYIVPDQIFVGK